MWLALLTSLWLGILTSISPCPLTTNIAAISYISRRVASRRFVLLSGLLYALGRTLVYVALSAIVVKSLLSIPTVSMFLQKYMDKIIGPLMIIVGMFLLGLIGFSTKGSSLGDKMKERVDKNGVWGAFLLGIVFAIALCPTSAALFFGSLIPLSLKFSSPILMPAIYGVGTAIPVIVFAIIIAFSAQLLGKAFKKLEQFDIWSRRITGALFILIGIYLSLKYIFNIF
jgi:cytochrome c biogenesis protein CcdA